jgi:hypothetical protein
MLLHLLTEIDHSLINQPGSRVSVLNKLEQMAKLQDRAGVDAEEFAETPTFVTSSNSRIRFSEGATKSSSVRAGLKRAIWNKPMRSSFAIWIMERLFWIVS